MGRMPTYQHVCGLPMPAGFPVEALRSAFEFSPGEGDVVLATYPKCGTTWMQHILHMLHHGGSAIDGDSSVRELVPHLEEMGAAFVDALPPPRLIKTHLHASPKLLNEKARYVLVFRNPFDCAVSFFHHTRGFVKHYDFADGTFDDFIELFIAGQVDFGDYFSHVRSWLDVADRSNVFLTTFERMKGDLIGEVAKLGDFLGGPAARAVSDRGMLQQIVDDASFNSMARQQQRWSSARPAGTTAFVRKGVVGDWRAHFSARPLRLLRDRTHTQLNGSVLLQDWAAVIDEVNRVCEEG